jgi:hypothetical protein
VALNILASYAKRRHISFSRYADHLLRPRVERKFAIVPRRDIITHIPNVRNALQAEHF